MTLLIVLFVILFFLCVGYTVLRITNTLGFFSLSEKLSFAYGLGVGLVSFQMLAYSLCKIPWSQATLLIPWAIIICLSFLIKRPSVKILITLPKGKINKLIRLGIVFTLGFVIFEAILRPLNAWDGWANWFLAGKAFYIAKGINFEFIQYAQNSTQPIIQLMLAFSFTLLGKVNDQYTLLLFTSFYVSIICMLYNSLKRILLIKYALLFTFLFATLENVIRHAGRFDVGHADLPLGYFFFACLLLLSAFLKNNTKKTLILLNIFLAIAALTKTEGVSFFVLIQIYLIFYLIKTKNYAFLFISLIGFLPVMLWESIIYFFHLPQNPFFTGTIQFERIPTVLEGMIVEFSNIGRWNLLWPAFFVCVFLLLKKGKEKIFITFCLLQLFVYFLIYLNTPLDPISHIQSSFDRLLLHLAPTAIFCIALAFAAKNTKGEKVKKV